MHIMLCIMLAVVVIDTLVALVFFRNALSVIVLIGALGLLGAWYWYAIRRRPGELAAGWVIGEAQEITNPDRPALTTAVIPQHVLKLGVLCLGAPGSGKTESFLLGFLHSLPQHSPGSGGAVFEGKGDIDIYKKAVAMGFVPDWFFSTELPGSDSINLMEGETHDVVDRLTRILVSTSESTSYYADAQRAVLSRVIPVLMSLGVPVSMRDLYVALSVEAAGAEVIRRARQASIDPVLRSMAEQWYEIDFKDRIVEIKGLLNRLFVFVNGPYADRLNCYQPDIHIADVVAGNARIYIHAPLTAFSRDVAIAIVEMFGVEARKRQLGGTESLTLFPILMDDWGGFFYEGFGPFSARCRSAAMPLSFSFQSLAQVKAASLHLADELDDNLATKMILRVQGEDTGGFALRLLGEYDTLDVGTSLLGDRDGTSLSSRRKWRIEPRQLRALAPGEAYISTLQPDGARMRAPLYKTRFALPPITGWQDVPMPSAKAHPEGQGLGLWDRYMNPAHIAELERQARAEADAVAVIL